MDETTIRLEDLRKKARAAYLYLACGLLAVILLGFLVELRPAALAGALMLLLYLVFLRGEIHRYKAAWQEALLHSSLGQYMEITACHDKDLFSLEQILQDGCVPISSPQGMVRVGVSGIRHGLETHLSDISCTYAYQTTAHRRRAVPLSGCYLRQDLPHEQEAPVVFCSRQLLPQDALDAYYAGCGLYPVSCPNKALEEKFFCYRPQDAPPFTNYAVCSLLAGLETRGLPVVKLADYRMTVFLCHRVLNAGEPDYRRPLSLPNASLLPEIQTLFAIADQA